MSAIYHLQLVTRTREHTWCNKSQLDHPQGIQLAKMQAKRKSRDDRLVRAAIFLLTFRIHLIQMRTAA